MARQIRLDTRVVFLRPVDGARSDTGGAHEGFEEAFQSYAAVRYLRGGEAVMESRMQGRRPAILTVRKRIVMSDVQTDWLVRFQGQDFEVRELPRLREDGATMEMLVEAIL